MLGPVPRATAALPVRQQELAVLQPGERAAVHDRRLFLLFLVHGQPDPVQSDVDEVQTSVPGNVVRLFGTTAEPHVPGPTVQFQGHDRAAKHDGQHHGVPQVRAPVHEEPAGRDDAAARIGARRRMQQLCSRRVGHDLAGQRERTAL